MPTPRENETESQFVARCVIDDEAIRDFPDIDQRLAFCYSEFEQSKKYVTKAAVNRYRDVFENERQKTETRNIQKTASFYKQEYFKGVDEYLKTNQIPFFGVFDNQSFKDIYSDIYEDTGLHFANWYSRNFDKYIEKGVNPSQYQTQWRESFATYGQAVAATNVTLVQGTARKTLQKVIRQLMLDEEFQSMGAAQQARIFRSQFSRYSQTQAERLVRTESTRAANYGVMQSAQTLFPKEQLIKQWVTSIDGRERDWHRSANGQRVPYTEKFVVGGEYMPFPGEGGSGRNVINCRCSILTFPAENAQAVAGLEGFGFGVSTGVSQGFSILDVARQAGTALVTNPDELNKIE